MTFGDGPDTTEIIVCAHRTPSNDHQGNRALRLIVARIAPRPVSRPNLLRLPRPDDPTPRKPPAFFGGSGKGGARAELTRIASAGSVLGGRELKRTASLSGAVAKRPKVADLGSGVRLGEEKSRGLFKVPQLPLVIGKGKEKARPVEGEPDVFGGSDMCIEDLNYKPQSEGKGKRKRSMHDNEVAETEEIMEMERANKNVCSHILSVSPFPAYS